MSSGHENLIPFDKRSKKEVRELARKGGKASGKTRREKANLRKKMNWILTIEADAGNLSDMLKANGGESSYEEIIAMAMVKEAGMGNVQAYNAIKDTIGQSNKDDLDIAEQESKIELNRVKKETMTGENEEDEALNKLDQILKEVHDDAVKQQTK